MAKKRARRAGGAEIADDVLREVFARLPGLQDLLRCAATCRRWRRLVTNRTFLRRIGHLLDTARRPCVLAGIFSQNTYPAGPAQLGKKKGFYVPPQFLSLQAAGGGGGTRLTFDSFVAFDEHDAHLARPLASRRGFLLVRLLLPGDYDGQKLHLAVCRPLLDKRSTRLLPPPPLHMTGYFDRSLIGCTILAGADDDDGNDKQPPTTFRVLLIYDDDNTGFVCACTYSSDTSAWSAPVECCRASPLTRCGPQAGVVAHGGTVHWLFMDRTKNFYTLNISAITTHVSLTAIPIKLDTSARGIRMLIPCIAGEEGMLSFVTIQHGLAELWTKQQKDHRDHLVAWQHSQLTGLGSETIDLVFFAESRALVEKGALVAVCNSH